MAKKSGKIEVVRVFVEKPFYQGFDSWCTTERRTKSDMEFFNADKLRERLQQMIDINTVFDDRNSQTIVETAKQILDFVNE